MAVAPKITVMLLVALIALTIPVLIGVYVYRDAKCREMNPVLWTLVAVLAPALVGFIIYLLVRNGYSDLECPRCGTPVLEQYVVCPQCGARLRPACPSCDRPIEPDWRVCPRCAAPLDGVQSDATPPLRRQDQTLRRILIAVIVVPAALILLMVIGFAAYSSATSYAGSVGLQELTFDQYDQEQPSDAVSMAVKRWVRSVQGDRDRACALRYDLPGEYEYENKFYFLIYIPNAGRQDDLSFRFSVGSGLFGTALKMDLEDTGDSGSLFCVEVNAEKPPRPEITVGGRRVPCSVREVEYNPTTFPIYPDYSQTEQEDVLYLPQRITVQKTERTGEGSGKFVDEVKVTDEDLIYKIMAAIDGGKRLDVGDPIYAGRDLGGAYLILVEYKVREELISHDDMARLWLFQQDGSWYLQDERIRHGDNIRLMGPEFHTLLESLF